MSANVIKTKFGEPVTRVRKKPTRSKPIWPAVATASLGGSGLFFIIGILLSAATTVGLIAASRLVAYVDVSILFTGFLLAFLGAHAMDRNDEERREKEREVFYDRNGSVVNLSAAKSRFARRK
jgi:hypothetical protein